jgi:uncharacterized protein
MILELKKFDNFPVHVELIDTFSKQNVEMDGISSIDKTMLELDIQKSGEEYFCQGQLTASVTVECSRCLKPLNQNIENETDFIISAPKTPGDSIIDDEDHVYFDHELRADLWEIVRQTVILAVSMKPLCSEDCRGLCPHCGTNLNEKHCECNVRTIDPRLEPLKKLLPSNNRKGL